MIINVPIIRNSGEEKGTEIPLDNLVIIDDLFNDVKDKIFYGNTEERDEFLYKNLLKYELEIITQDDHQIIHVFENKQLLFNFDDDILTTSKIRLLITNIFDVISDEFYTTYLLGENSQHFDDLFQKYNVEFIDLTKKDLWYCIITHVYSNEKVKLSSNDTRESISDTFDEFLNYLTDAYNIIKTKMSEERLNLQNYYKEIKTEKESETDIKYDTIEIEYRPDDFISGAKGRFINLVTLFNTLELNLNIPFILLNARINKSENPVSRIFNNTIASDREIKSWSLNEKIKDTVYTFKRISGLLVKYKIKNNNNYISLIVNESGIIKVIWNNIYRNIEIDLNHASILEYIDSCVEDFFNIISGIKGVFKNGKKVNSLNNYTRNIKSIDALVNTNVFIDRFDFSKLLNNKTIIEKMFMQKDTISLDTLYLYYLKLGNEENRISVYIKDNLYEKGSIIYIYNIKNVIQIHLIIQQLISIYYTLENRNTTQVLTDKGRIKDLRAAGVEISSVKCQSGQQPLINEEGDEVFQKLKQENRDVYQVEYKNIRYTCPTKIYPYVGINTNNGICCFKRDQRSKPDYIRVLHPELIDVDVQPSNFTINITETGNDIPFTTYVIKVVYSLQNDYKYHFINSQNKFIPIINEDLIRQIDIAENNAPESSTIWLETVPIFQLTNNPPKNKCNETPNVYDKEDGNIHKPCKHVNEYNFFGYTTNSYPCCFSSPPTTYNSIEKKKKKDVFTKDIITGEKILDNTRLGVLHPNLKVLFNTYLKKERGVFYRYGINQGKYAILNTILNSELSLHKSPFDILTDIEKYLQSNINVIDELNNGYIVEKFSDIDNKNTINRYMNYLKTNDHINPIDIIDILQRMFDVNIHIFQIPLKVTQYKKEFIYDNIRILCKAGIKSNYSKNLILIKRSKYYELITNVDIIGKNLQTIFKNEDLCVQFINNYSTKTCINKQVYPEKFMYEKLHTFETVKQRLQGTMLKIKANIFYGNKIVMLLLKKNKEDIYFFLPIFQKGKIIEEKNFSLVDISQSENIMDFNDYIKNLPYIQTIFPEYNFVGYILNSHNKINTVLTSYGIHIPVKETDETETIKKLIDKMHHTYDININVANKDLLDNYLVNSTELYQKIYKIKSILGKILEKTPSIKDHLLTIVINVNTSRTIKFNKIKIKIKNLCKQLSEKYPEFIDIDDIIVSDIVNEIINDNIENNLLNNNIIMTHVDSSKIISRDSESILITMDDILKWIKNFKN